MDSEQSGRPAPRPDLDVHAVVHDVNQLLGVITGRVELMLRRDAEGDRRRDLEAIGLAAADAGRILARLHGGMPPAVAAAPLLEAGLQSGGLILPADSLWTLAVDIAPNLVCGVPAHVLREVLNNLLTNARAALPDGGQIELAARVAGDRIELLVRDDGPGIPADAREAIFARGETSSGDRTRGVGLPASRALLAAYGGDLACIDSDEGGAVFRLDLPTAAQELPVPEVSVGHARDDVVSHLRPGRVLIVDDDPATRDMLTDVLADCGQQVRAFRDAQTALDGFETGTYDVAFMDLKLPGLSGLELAARLRSRDPWLALVLITGWSRPDDRAALEDPSGPVDLVGSKPLALTTIHGLLAGAQLLRDQRAKED